LPEGLDTAVLRIETTFDVRGLVTQITSYDAATSGMVVNDVQREYNGFQQLTREYQEHGGPVDGSSLHVDYSYADGSANTIRRTGCVYPNGRNVSYLYHSPGDDQLSRVSAIADGTLLQGLISYWPLNESVSSGDRDDAQDGNTLVDTNNNVSHDTGNPSGNLGVAAAFDGSSAQLRLYPLGNLSFNRQSFTTTGWIYFNDVSASIGMWGAGIAHSSNIFNQAWSLVLDATHFKISFLISDGTNYNFNESTVAPSVGQWYFVAAWYDADVGKSYIQINDGTPHEFTGVGPTDRDFELVIGRSYGYWLDGRAQAVGVWDRVLTDDERAALYNGSDGLQYPFGVQPLAEYTYLGLVTPVIVDYSQPQVKYDLAISDGMGDKYTGLDRFGRVFNNLWQDYNSTPVSAVELHYGYDRASNRLWRQDIVAGSANFDELYTYDGLYRLTDMKRGRLNGTQTALNSGSENFEQQWNLDKTGNWTGFQEDSTGGGSWTLDQSRAANPVNEITDITNTTGDAWTQPGYDAAGNMTTIPQPADMSGQFTATYDAWNRLVRLFDPANGYVVQENAYDGLNRRTIQKVYDYGPLIEERHYYYSDSWQILEERLGDIPTSTDPDRHFIWGMRYIDDLVLRDCSTTGTLNERLFALQDANWNMVAICDPSGSIKERYAYTPYGAPIFLNPDFTLAFNQFISAFDWETLYCSYRWDRGDDGNVALYQVRNRYMHSHLGRWITVDPLLSSTLEPSSDAYAYCKGAPIGRYDPLGLKHWRECEEEYTINNATCRSTFVRCQKAYWQCAVDFAACTIAAEEEYVGCMFNSTDTLLLAGSLITTVIIGEILLSSGPIGWGIALGVVVVSAFSNRSASAWEGKLSASFKNAFGNIPKLGNSDKCDCSPSAPKPKLPNFAEQSKIPLPKPDSDPRPYSPSYSDRIFDTSLGRFRSPTADERDAAFKEYDKKLQAWKSRHPCME
jgi:RHS repeat-associated protein